MIFMWNWDKVCNPIFKINFLGFQSDSYTLQKRGWSFSMFQSADMYSIGFALRHEQAGLKGITDTYHSYEIMRIAQSQKDFEIPCTFTVIKLSSQLDIFSMQLPAIVGAFDATPFSSTLANERRSFDDIFPFKTLAQDAVKEIVVAPASVNELLDMALKMQDPKQREIRERQRKEAFLKHDIQQQYNPAKDIKAQIICLAS